MASIAVLEREIVKNDETKQRELTLAEAKHTASRHEAYLRSFGNQSNNAQNKSAGVQVLEREAPAVEKKPAMPADHGIALEPARKSRALFMDYDYRDGTLIRKTTKEPVDVLVKAPEAPASVETPKAAAIVAPAPVQTEEDDAIPTRRTMETLKQTAAAVPEEVAETRTGFFAALSAKTKLVLLSVVAAVVLALVIICVNTAIINSINADIEGLRGKVTEQQNTYSTINEEIQSLEDPNSEVVSQWAQEHGMTRGD